MDFEKEYELESAGIDAFEFSLMDEDERREVLEDNYLDPDDFDMIDLDPEFQAWENLQNAGMDLSDLSLMDEDEKKEALENAGLNPSDYGIDSDNSAFDYLGPPPILPVSSPAPSKPPESKRKENKPAVEKVLCEKNVTLADGSSSKEKKDLKNTEPWDDSSAKGESQKTVYHLCGVRFEEADTVYSYHTNGLDVKPGDLVEVPVGHASTPKYARVVSVGDYTADAALYPIAKTKSILCKVSPESIRPPALDKPKSVETRKHIKAKKRKKQKHGLTAAVVFFLLFLLLLAGILLYEGVFSQPEPSPASSAVPTPSPKVTAVPTPKPSATPKPTPKPTATPAPSPTPTPYTGLKPTYPAYQSGNYTPSVSTPKPTPRPTPKPKPANDPYNAHDYAHPDDFYYDYYDDFWDYEDAEDYWEAHH